MVRFVMSFIREKTMDRRLSEVVELECLIYQLQYAVDYLGGSATITQSDIKVLERAKRALETFDKRLAMHPF